MVKKFFLCIVFFLFYNTHAMNKKTNQEKPCKSYSFSDDDLSSLSSNNSSPRSSSSDLTVYSSSSYEQIPIGSVHEDFTEQELRKIEDLGLNEVELPIKRMAEVITKLHFDIAFNDSLLDYPLALKYLTIAKKAYKRMAIEEKKRFHQHEIFMIELLLKQQNTIQILEENTHKKIEKNINRFARVLNTQAIVRSSLSKITQKPLIKKIKHRIFSRKITCSDIFITMLTVSIVIMFIYQLFKLNILGDTLATVQNTVDSLYSTVNGTLKALNSTVNNALSSVNQTVSSVTGSLQNTTQQLSNIQGTLQNTDQTLNSVQTSVTTLNNATNAKLDTILSQCKILP